MAYPGRDCRDFMMSTYAFLYSFHTLFLQKSHIQFSQALKSLRVGTGDHMGDGKPKRGQGWSRGGVWGRSSAPRINQSINQS